MQLISLPKGPRHPNSPVTRLGPALCLPTPVAPSSIHAKTAGCWLLHCRCYSPPRQTCPTAYSRPQAPSSLLAQTLTRRILHVHALLLFSFLLFRFHFHFHSYHSRHRQRPTALGPSLLPPGRPPSRAHHLMPSYGSQSTPSLRKMENGHTYGQRSTFSVGRIIGDPFALATISIAIVSAPSRSPSEC